MHPHWDRVLFCVSQRLNRGSCSGSKDSSSSRAGGNPGCASVWALLFPKLPRSNSLSLLFPFYALFTGARVCVRACAWDGKKAQLLSSALPMALVKPEFGCSLGRQAIIFCLAWRWAIARYRLYHLNSSITRTYFCSQLIGGQKHFWIEISVLSTAGKTIEPD